MSKKQGKIQIFERLKNEGVYQDPELMVNLIVKPSTIEESNPILRLFFFIATSLKKKFFCVYRRATYLREKKNSTRGKKFFSPPPNIEEYVLEINQSDRCLEDT